MSAYASLVSGEGLQKNRRVPLDDALTRAIGVPVVGFLLPTTAGMLVDMRISTVEYWFTLAWSSFVVYLAWSFLVAWGMKCHSSSAWVKSPYGMAAWYVSGSILALCVAVLAGGICWYGARGVSVDWGVMQRLFFAGAVAVFVLTQFYLALYTRWDLSFTTSVVRVRAEEASVRQASPYRQEPESVLGALRTLSRLVDAGSPEAVCYASELAVVHRYVLSAAKSRLVLLHDELRVLAAHQRLLRVRFANEFELSVQISSEQAGRYLIVPATLHVLLEIALTFDHVRVEGHPNIVEVSLRDEHIELSYPTQRHLVTQAEALRLDALSSRTAAVAGTGLRLQRSNGRIKLFVPIVSLP